MESVAFILRSPVEDPIKLSNEAPVLLQRWCALWQLEQGDSGSIALNMSYFEATLVTTIHHREAMAGLDLALFYFGGVLVWRWFFYFQEVEKFGEIFDGASR